MAYEMPIRSPFQFFAGALPNESNWRRKRGTHPVLRRKPNRGSHRQCRAGQPERHSLVKLPSKVEAEIEQRKGQQVALKRNVIRRKAIEPKSKADNGLDSGDGCMQSVDRVLSYRMLAEDDEGYRQAIHASHTPLADIS